MKAQDKRPDDAQRNVERTLLVTTQVIRRELHIADGELLGGYGRVSLLEQGDSVTSILTRVERRLKGRESVILQHMQESLQAANESKPTQALIF